MTTAADELRVTARWNGCRWKRHERPRNDVQRLAIKRSKGAEFRQFLRVLPTLGRAILSSNAVRLDQFVSNYLRVNEDACTR